MKEQVKFDVWFQKNIQNILWNEDFMDVLLSARDKNHGDVIKFNGEEFFIEASGPKKLLVWGVPVKIDDNDQTFIFKIPVFIDDHQKLMDLNNGVCHITHPDLNEKQAYSVSGYYDMNDNMLQIEKIHAIS